MRHRALFSLVLLSLELVYAAHSSSARAQLAPPFDFAESSNALKELFGSAAYIGNGLIVSNAHVCTRNARAWLFNAGDDGTPPYSEGGALCASGDSEGALVPDCERHTFYAQGRLSHGRVIFVSRALDLCILRAEDAAWSHLPRLHIATAPVQRDQVVMVAGFPEPSRQRTAERCRVISEPALVRDPDQIRPSDAQVVSFAIDCTTPEHGSSGSPVFDAEGRLLGLVWTGECAGESCEGPMYVTAASAWRAGMATQPIAQWSQLDALLRTFSGP